MANGLQVNVSGVWKEIDKGYVNIEGVWKEVSKLYTNIAGVWKEVSLELLLSYYGTTTPLQYARKKLDIVTGKP